MGCRTSDKKLIRKYASGRLDENDRSILDRIKRSESGIGAKALAIEVGQAHNTVGSKLRCMKNLGMIAMVGHSCFAVWCTTDRAKSIKERRDAARSRPKGIKAPPLRKEAPDNPMMQIWKRAGEWAPLPIRGPVSVWDLA